MDNDKLEYQDNYGNWYPYTEQIQAVLPDVKTRKVKQQAEDKDIEQLATNYARGKNNEFGEGSNLGGHRWNSFIAGYKANTVNKYLIDCLKDFCDLRTAYTGDEFLMLYNNAKEAIKKAEQQI